MLDECAEEVFDRFAVMLGERAEQFFDTRVR